MDQFAMDQFAMDQFVERQNIAHYAEQLKTEPDPNKRTTLERLLARGKGQTEKSRDFDFGIEDDESRSWPKEACVESANSFLWFR
jgi:hypothetical protein